MKLPSCHLLIAISIAALLSPASAEEVEKALPGVKIDPAPVGRQAGVITSFAPVVEKVATSVVQIATSKNVKRNSRNPMFNDPGFRRFFGIPEPEDEEQDERPQRRGRDGQQKQAMGLGSGVIVSTDGHIMTNNHVIDGADDILVTFVGDKKEYKAKKVGGDSGTDLALLKIEGKGGDMPAITFGDSDKLRVGDIAIAVGNPFGLTQTVTMGIVSSLGRNDMGIVAYENFIQTDASINPGNSGGALVDIDGRLIGINTAIFSRTGTNNGIGFAVPANLVRQIMDSLLKNGRVVRGYLGVGIQPLDETLAGRFKIGTTDGTLVNSVEPKGPADRAGLEAGDVITELNGKKIAGPSELRMTVGGLNPGTKVDVVYLRNGESRKAQIELAELPTGKRNLVPTEDAPTAEPDVLDGVTVGDLTSELRQKYEIPETAKGVLVLEIEASSPSAAAGIRVGDVIHEIERTPVKSANDAVEMSEKLKKEKEVLLRVSTRGASRFVVVKEGE
jgi:serine protease Do